MKIKNYFNNLEKYWSANFLALISSTFLLTFIIWILVNLVGLAFQAESFSKYVEIISNLFLFYPLCILLIFPFSYFLFIFITIFYLFAIIFKKQWCIILGIVLGIISNFILLSIFFRIIGEAGAYVGLFILPLCITITFIGILISIGLYPILLLSELIPKFRIPKSLISQNNIFKIYIRIFYLLYFVMIWSIFYSINWLMWPHY